MFTDQSFVCLSVCLSNSNEQIFLNVFFMCVGPEKKSLTRLSFGKDPDLILDTKRIQNFQISNFEWFFDDWLSD